MDFFQISLREKKGVLEAYPDFIVGRSEDLMVRAKTFYAVWDEEKGLWSTDEYDVQRIVDSRLKSFHDENPHVGQVKYMRNFSSNGQSTFRKYLSQIGDNAHQLDETLTFQGTKVGKKDYVSKRLPYDLAPGDYSAWNEIVSTLYDEKNREIIEWTFGAIIAGASKTIQKFVVLEGPPGAGKGTIINIALMLFDGYVTTFDAKALGSNGNQFAAAAFAGNPLVAIQHDGDLSRIEDNTLLNSIVSHEIMKVNEKYKPSYDARINAFLIMGTNKPVRITDAQSGLIRRLIDVHPTGNKIPKNRYDMLMEQVKFQLGAIAHRCLQVYKQGGKTRYNDYEPMLMLAKTNEFYNYIETYHDVFEKQGGVSATQAWKMYKEYCEDANIKYPMQRHTFRAELGNYFEEFHERIVIDGTPVRSYYKRLKTKLYKAPADDDPKSFTLVLEDTTSLLNLELADYPAQYATAAGSPRQRWMDVKTTLAEIDTTREHYVQGFPENLIVIDFDLRDENGKKSREKNLQAAATWPPTYAEFSKSGEGVHLHYYYEGDVEQLDPVFDDGIEVKVYRGGSALRRKLTFCNSVAIATLAVGALAFKEKKRVIDQAVFKSEKGLRAFVEKNLRKEYHPGTKSSIDFIKKGLDDAYDSGLTYNLEDLQQKIIVFANNSTNQPMQSLRVVQQMRWKSDEEDPASNIVPQDERLVIYDVEVFPNLFVICWKFKEDNPSVDSVVRMVNPKPHEVEALFSFKLVGFNVKDYDNHILWAAAMGYSNQKLYELSKSIIDGSKGAKFGEAYDLSHTDIHDFATKKQSLKKWQVALGLKHKELNLPWDKPVPPERIQEVEDYCANDVVSTEQLFDYLQGDYKARLILADLSGLDANQSTQKLTARIVFGKDKNPQREFKYTDLSKEFPGYAFNGREKIDKSTYRGISVGEGGLVRAKPGIYRDVKLLDVASMHPTSIGQLNLFGDEYTSRFMALVHAQLAIKRGDYAEVKTLFDGKLAPYIEDIEELFRTDPKAAEEAAGLLRYGLKIAINIVYGLTSATFENPFRDWRNKDNIVAKRGALFMVDLMYFIEEELEKTVVHIKTDSVKVVGATDADVEAIKTFSAKYGYDMEYNPKTDHYEKLALVNDAVYVAKKAGSRWVDPDPDSELSTYDQHKKNKTMCWTATGTQFIPDVNPYVFKKLFGYEDSLVFRDYCLAKSVREGEIFIDFGTEQLLDDGTVVHSPMMDIAAAKVKKAEKSKDLALIPEALKFYNEALEQLQHVGKTGLFTPVKQKFGGTLWRVKDGKVYAVTGTKGWYFQEADVVEQLPFTVVDVGYFEKQLDDARATLEKFIEDSEFDTLEDFLQ